MVRSADTMIRSARTEDTRAILDLLSEMDAEDGASRSAVITAEHLREHVFCSAPRAEALLAFVDGDAAGLAAFRMSASTFWSGLEVFLDDLYVVPDHRRRRIGSDLLGVLSRLALERSAWRILLNVQADNEGAIRFYDSVGGSVFPQSRACALSGETLRRLARTAAA